MKRAARDNGIILRRISEEKVEENEGEENW